MRLNSKLYFFCLLLVIVLFSCTLQKRTYLQGYSITWNAFRPNAHPADSVKNRQENSSSLLSGRKQIRPAENPFIKHNTGTVLAFNRQFVSAPDTAHTCDSIFFKHKDPVAAKIVSINPTEVHYRWCDNSDGPEYVSRKSNITRIKYANGLEEIVDQPETPTATYPARASDRNTTARPDEPQKPKKLNILALLGMLCNFTIILIPIGAAMCIIALIQIKNHPGEYSGKIMALIGLWFLLLIPIAIILYFVAIVVVLLLFF